MATKTKGKDLNVQMVHYESGDTIHEVYPITKDENIQVTPVNNVPSDATDVEKVLGKLGSLAFRNSAQATSTQDGLMAAADKKKLDGIAAGAQVNTITGVKGDSETAYRTGNVNITKGNIGLGNVENKNSATIRGEITSANVTDALGYTPPTQDTTYTTVTTKTAGLMSAADKAKLDGIASGAQVNSLTGVKGDSETTYRTGNVNITKANIGLSNVENKSSETIRGELTSKNVTDALGYIPPTKDTTYGYATPTQDGIMSREDKAKLNGIAAGANAYTHPSYTAYDEGLYKVTVNGQGHVTKATAVAKADITALGIPGQDTTYGAATTDTAGLMSATDKAKLNGIASGAQVNSITGVKGDSETAYRTGNVNITKANIGLSNVENKSSATIRGEMTKSDVTTALGYTPPTTNTTYGIATSTTPGLIKSGGDITVDATSGVVSINDNSHSHSISNISGLQSALDSKLNTSLKGAKNGLASLDANGTVPASQLPSYVDDVVDVSMASDLTSATNASGATITPETSKIYIDDIGTSATNKTYRWSGTKYVVISETLALGETSSTAFDGARGKVAYNHSQSAHARVDATNTKASTTNGHISINGADTTVYTHPSYTAHNAGFYKVTVDSQGHVSGATAVTKADITALGIPGQDTNTTYGVVSSSSNGLMSPSMLNTLNSVNSAIGGKYSSSGGTLNGNLSFPDIGDTGESKGITWAGSSDSAKIYYKTTAKDAGHLVLQAGDDSNARIDFEWYLTDVDSKVTTKSYITSDGVYHGTATYAQNAGSANSVAWGNVTGKPATYYTHPSYTSHASGLYKVTVDGTGHVSAVSNVTKADITALGIPGQDTNTTYSVMKGSTSDASGSPGLVPAPDKGGNNRYLRSDGTWVVPPDTTYGVATTTTNGLMSSAMLSKLNGITSGANAYVHPSYTAHGAGFYKVSVDSQGHVSGATAVTKADITALGIPGQDTNTTYGAAGSSLGLMKSGGDLTISDGVAQVNDDSHNHHIIVSYGNHAETASGTTANDPTAGMKTTTAGMYMTQSYNDKVGATPTTYGNIINLVGAGTGQLFLGWSGADNTLERLYYRSHRDTSTGGWSKWGAVAYLDDVNKSYIGLSNVQNYDQSKAIKSITRNGTTFTATALDGTTTTFTQQDNNTTYAKATSSADGLMSAADKAKLDGVASGANKYIHPGYTAHAAGLYKVTVDSQGHVSGATAVTKADITALGIPGQDTTYSLAGLNGVSKSGDTMTGNLTFSPLSTAPGNSAGISWSGSTDYAQIYYDLEGDNAGNLVIYVGDDGNEKVKFVFTKGSTTSTASYISSDGVYHGTATYANSAGSANSVAWGNVSGKPSTYTPSTHTHTIAQVTNLQSSLDAKVNRSGDTMTGALNFANATMNKVGDDVAIGDFNESGTLAIKGLNGPTTLALIGSTGSSWNTSEYSAHITHNTTDKCLDIGFW